MQPPTLPKDKAKAFRTPNNQTSSAEKAGGGVEVGSGHCLLQQDRLLSRFRCCLPTCALSSEPNLPPTDPTREPHPWGPRAGGHFSSWPAMGQ